MEEFIIQLEAINLMLEEDDGGAFGVSLNIAVTNFFPAARYLRKISKEERDIQAPVILTALRADGVLRFANRVQRQTLIRELSRAAESTDSIQFLKPPASD